ncbi:hypothetical protein [Chroococcidiopsis sp. CCMEE 29]|uniref:hypothetical protein n=1 Tax=Chroococcidiopsis sp. CCMEE 29 TaxID=155894 RepID=UPI0020206208|nr:hypothetical protein [Chroococcidiopsis sp. CCMEE 29]
MTEHRNLDNIFNILVGLSEYSASPASSEDIDAYLQACLADEDIYWMVIVLIANAKGGFWLSSYMKAETADFLLDRAVACGYPQVVEDVKNMMKTLEDQS